MPKHSRKLLEQADSVIAKAIIKQEVGPTAIYEYSYSLGDSIDIAYSVMTNNGQFFRIKGTSRWLSNEQVDIGNQTVPFTDYRFKESPNGVTLNRSKS